jgi:hypothetical protein
MTLPQVYELLDYWERHPPLHLLVAGYLGYRPQRKSDRAAAAPRDIGALLGLAPGGVGRVEQLRGLD